ncbi:MAG: hypothetical protein ACOYMS_06090 [Terrimicrobiaceae bacterium]
MKLRERLKLLKKAADAMESFAARMGMCPLVAVKTRAEIQMLRLERPEKRRARKWTKG